MDILALLMSNVFGWDEGNFPFFYAKIQKGGSSRMHMPGKEEIVFGGSTKNKGQMLSLI